MSKLLPIQYAKVLYYLTKEIDEKNLDKILKEYLLFLKKEHVFTKINYIVKEFEKYSKKQEGISQIEITSSEKLEEDKIKEIVKKFGEKIEVKTKIDKNIIGGIIIKNDNTILDASIKTQLNKLKKHLS